METNIIFVLVATIMIGALIVTSNMSHREQKQTIFLITLTSIAIGMFFASWGYYLIGAVLVGVILGEWVNSSIVKRRVKILNQLMKENKTSL